MAKQWLIAMVIIVVAILGAGAFLYLEPEEAAQERRQKRVSPVNVVLPASAVVRDKVAAVGTLRAREAVELTSEVNGRVVALNFRPGEKVAKGQLLVRLDDRQAQVDLKVVEAQLADARRQYERAQSLRSNNSISQAQVDELSTAMAVLESQRVAAQTRLEDHRIEAPFAGIVGLVDLSVGAYVTTGESIATLDATDRMELTFSVPERYIGQISQGQGLTARTAAFPDEVFEGTLAELGSRLSDLSRSLPVKAWIDNPELRLRPGQFMSVSLTLRERQALVIPEQAVLVQGDKAFVFTTDGEQARRTEVQLGAREPGQVEVLAGLNAEDSVVITGQDRLSSGDKVTVVEDDNALVSSDAFPLKHWQ
ncbi:efflux RND transporter periplasmic adaptor subunit [Marinobacter salicampi]|uniref:efflux RND transporter periplasmic adaptor subunit n=1 Tax=Marinobacter salicampi TaxID=435907 RepID=UPI00140B2B74|nr:efflux RND transporter periplasmic adaptor subunit [Marinobacter salicampi]